MIRAACEYVAGAADITATVSSMTDGRVLESGLPAGVIRIPVGASNGERFRSVIVRPFGQGADNSQFTVRLWAHRRTGAVAGRQSAPRDPMEVTRTSIDGSVIKMGELVCTLGTCTGVANGVIGTGYRFADTVAWTPSTWWLALESGFGATAGAYSPGNNTPGEFIIPDCFGVEEIIAEFTMTTATSANLLVELQT